MNIIKGMTLDLINIDTLKYLDEMLEKGERPETILAYKAVKTDYISPNFWSTNCKLSTIVNGVTINYTGIKYSLNKIFKVKTIETNSTIDCGYGLHVASKEWVEKIYHKTKRIRNPYGDGGKDMYQKRFIHLQVKVMGEIVIPKTDRHNYSTNEDFIYYYGKFRTTKLKVLKEV